MDQIYYYLPALETIRDFIELGGNVLFIIGFLTLFMWILIVERLVYLRSGHKRLAATALQIWESRDDHKSWNAHQIRSRLISQVASRGRTEYPVDPDLRRAVPPARLAGHSDRHGRGLRGNGHIRLG